MCIYKNKYYVFLKNVHVISYAVVKDLKDNLIWLLGFTPRAPFRGLARCRKVGNRMKETAVEWIGSPLSHPIFS